MSLDEKFDKIIKQKVSEAEFPFDENNWQKASKLIDAERGAAIGAKSGKMFLLIGTLFLGVAAGTFFFLTMKSDKVENKGLAQNTTSNNIVADASGQGNAEVSNAVQVKNETTQENNSSSNTANESNTSTQASKASIEMKQEENNSNSNTKVETVAASNDTKAEDGAVADTKINNSANLNSPEANKPNGDAGTEKTAKANSSSASTKSGKTQNPDHKPGSTKPRLGPEAQNFYSNKSKTTPKETPLEVVLNSAAKAADDYDYLEMHSSVLQLWKKDEALQNSPHDFLRGIDDDYFKKSRRKIHFINLEAGGAYLLGWQGAVGSDAAGLNVFGGLNYELHLKNKLNVGIGAQFYNIGHIKNSFYDRQNFEYDFGANSHYTSVTANSLYYIGIPVRISRYITRSSKIGVGLNTGILVGGKNTVTTYSEKDMVKSNITSVKGKGVYEGLNNTNMMLSVFYTQHLNRRFSLNGEFVYGLSDTYKRSATLNSSKENNMGVRLSLQFTLFPIK